MMGDRLRYTGADDLSDIIGPDKDKNPPYEVNPTEYQTQVHEIAHLWSELTDDEAPLNFIAYKAAAQAFLAKYNVTKKE